MITKAIYWHDLKRKEKIKESDLNKIYFIYLFIWFDLT